MGTSHKIHQVAGDIATQPNKNQPRRLLPESPDPCPAAFHVTWSRIAKELEVPHQSLHRTFTLQPEEMLPPKYPPFWRNASHRPHHLLDWKRLAVSSQLVTVSLVYMDSRTAKLKKWWSSPVDSRVWH